MREPSYDSPISALFGGIGAAFTGVIGFIAAVVAGVVIGFASNDAAFSDAQDPLFAVYLFIFSRLAS